MKTELLAIQGDITEIEVDAIVNAANNSLLGGGGIDGAIHRAAGPKLLEECRSLGGCETGQAKITKGYNLPAKYVIHTVGPVYGEEDGQEEKLLKSCYLNSLKLAREIGIKSIAFPAISTGVYGYPKDEASKIAMETVQEFIAKNPEVFQKIFLVFFNDIALQINSKFTDDTEPEDKELIELFKKAIKGEIFCTTAVADLDVIQPFSDYRPKVSDDYRNYFTQTAKEGNPPAMYVYVKDKKLVMSDNYNAYAMYKELDLARANCIVIGDTPKIDGVTYCGESYKMLPLSAEIIDNN